MREQSRWGDGEGKNHSHKSIQKDRGCNPLKMAAETNIRRIKRENGGQLGANALREGDECGTACSWIAECVTP